MRFIIVVALLFVVVLVYRAVQKSKLEQQASSSSANTAAADSTTEADTVSDVNEEEQPETKEQPAEEVDQAAATPSFEMPAALAENAAFLAEETDPLARHRLLSSLTESSYKNRKDTAFRSACHYFSAQHIAEFEQIAAPLKESNRGTLPQVMTFQNYANLLVEDKEFNQAIDVCQKALSFGLDDKTKTGFEGRIARIEAQREKS